MKVYARYIKENGMEYRFDTLLQFGDSWGLIGNIVLANPGSSNPLSCIDEKDAIKIQAFFDKYRNGVQIEASEWFSFSPDSTMQQIEKIFNGFYTDCEKIELNGVVQLFNCFNIKNQNLEDAINQLESTQRSDAITSAEITSFFGEKPVYFGFSQNILNHNKLKQTALSIFEGTPKELRVIFDDNFDNNKFYHPGYINRSYSRDKYVKENMHNFLTLIARI